jgi:hypothetical protein
MDIPYYLELQRRAFDIFRYISCHDLNFETHSVIIESALVDTGSFFDSLCQTFIRGKSMGGHAFRQQSSVGRLPEKVAGQNFNFPDYRTLLEGDYELSTYRVNLNPYEPANIYNPLMHSPDSISYFLIAPFEEWARAEQSPWWKAFTDLKHDRIRNSREAKLRHLIFALAAAFIVLSLQHQAEFRDGLVPTEIYDLFFPKYWRAAGRIFPGTITWAPN